jgi:hypothetical protein
VEKRGRKRNTLRVWRQTQKETGYLQGFDVEIKTILQYTLNKYDRKVRLD